ncbi:MAG: hypothetical protein K2H06_06235 [Anaeroplasmataceae bacterium]|nr:hypothetical protein [Anaeroplasmataceae bacterium]
MKTSIKTFFTIIILGIIILCISGCNTEFAKKEYDDAEKIVQMSDHSVESNSAFKSLNGSHSFTASKFDGRKNLWKKSLEKNVDVEVQFELSISSGYAKIVHIDSNKNITVLVECSQDDSTEQSGTKIVSFTSGLNQLKIVAYDCKDLSLKLFFELS